MNQINMSENQKEPEVIDHVTESILGIMFKKTFYADNTVRHFVNDVEVSAFTTTIIGKNKKELVVTIVAKADE
jgi:hypothetical protein